MEMLGNGAGMNVGQEFAKTARRRDPEWSPQPLRGSPAIRITPSMCSLGLLGQRALLRRGWSAWQHGFAVRKLQTPGREADCAKIRVAFQSRQHQIECENKKTRGANPHPALRSANPPLTGSRQFWRLGARGWPLAAQEGYRSGQPRRRRSRPSPNAGVTRR